MPSDFTRLEKQRLEDTYGLNTDFDVNREIFENPVGGVYLGMRDLGKDHRSPFGAYIMQSLPRNLPLLFDMTQSRSADDSTQARANFYRNYVKEIYDGGGIDFQQAGGLLRDALAGGSSLFAEELRTMRGPREQFELLRGAIYATGVTAMSGKKAQLMEMQLQDMYFQFLEAADSGRLDMNDTTFAEYLVDRAADFLNVWWDDQSFSFGLDRRLDPAAGSAPGAPGAVNNAGAGVPAASGAAGGAAYGLTPPPPGYHPSAAPPPTRGAPPPLEQRISPEQMEALRGQAAQWAASVGAEAPPPPPRQQPERAASPRGEGLRPTNVPEEQIPSPWEYYSQWAYSSPTLERMAIGPQAVALARRLGAFSANEVYPRQQAAADAIRHAANPQTWWEWIYYNHLR